MSDYDISFYIQLVRKWIIGIIVVAVLAGGVTYAIAETRAPMYQSSALVSIGGFLITPNPDLNEVRVGFELADTYARLVKTTTVMQAVIDDLQLDISLRQLSQATETEILLNTSLLQITVRFDDPDLAALLANALAQQLIEQNPSNITPELQQQVTISTSQIETLEAEVTVLQQLAGIIDTQIAETTDETERLNLVERRTAINQELNELASNIAQFSTNITQIEQSSNSLTLVDPAQPRYTPINMSSALLAVIAIAFIGVTLSGCVLIYEYVRITHPVLQSIPDAQSRLQLPVLGTLLTSATLTKRTDELITNLPPRSPVVESFNVLCTNLRYKARKNKGIFIFTYPISYTPQANTMYNIALSMGENGARVALVNANRAATPQQTFDNLPAITPTLPETLSEKQVIDHLNKHTMLSDNVAYFPAIGMSDDPARLLHHNALTTWLASLRGEQGFDMVFIDTTPVLLAADAMVLAVRVKVEIILLFKQGDVDPAVLERARERLNQVGGEVSGLVMYKVKSLDSVAK